MRLGINTFLFVSPFTTESTALVVFKEEVLPIQFYTGMLTAAFEKLRGVHIACKWEKTAASRIEMTLSW